MRDNSHRVTRRSSWQSAGVHLTAHTYTAKCLLRHNKPHSTHSLIFLLHFRHENMAEWPAWMCEWVVPSLPHIRIARSPPQEASSAPVGLHATYQQRESGCALSLCTSCSVAFISLLHSAPRRVRTEFSDLLITRELQCSLLRLFIRCLSDASDFLLGFLPLRFLSQYYCINSIAPLHVHEGLQPRVI